MPGKQENIPHYAVFNKSSFVQRKKFGKKDSSEHTYQNDEQPAGPTQQSTTDVGLNEELFASCDSSVIEEDVIEVSEPVPAQSAPSETETYLSSHETQAFSDE